jgi:hypothetical protein
MMPLMPAIRPFSQSNKTEAAPIRAPLAVAIR